MADTKEAPALEEELPKVDLSPEAKESQALVKRAAADLIDRGRVQCIIEAYREHNPHVKGIVGNDGQPVPMPPIICSPRWVEIATAMLVPLIQDCIEDTEQEIVRKYRRGRRSEGNGRRGVESLSTALAPFRNKLTVPPTPSH